MSELREARAVAKSVRMSPRKARLVIDLIRGKNVGQAIGILHGVESPISLVVLKTLNSAIANAEVKELNVEKLFVKEIFVNPGAILKRFRARAKGSGNRILKRSSHLTVVVAEKE
jgi:large subunit ribosomal protein L22